LACSSPSRRVRHPRDPLLFRPLPPAAPRKATSPSPPTSAGPSTRPRRPRRRPLVTSFCAISDASSACAGARLLPSYPLAPRHSQYEVGTAGARSPSSDLETCWPLRRRPLRDGVALSDSILTRRRAPNASPPTCVPARPPHRDRSPRQFSDEPPGCPPHQSRFLIRPASRMSVATSGVPAGPQVIDALGPSGPWSSTSFILPFRPRQSGARVREDLDARRRTPGRHQPAGPDLPRGPPRSPCRIAMRYRLPTAADALRRLQSRGVREPPSSSFPLRDVELRDRRRSTPRLSAAWSPPDLHIRTASPFFEDDGYIAAWPPAPPKPSRDDHVLFSFHGLLTTPASPTPRASTASPARPAARPQAPPRHLLPRPVPPHRRRGGAAHRHSPLVVAFQSASGRIPGCDPSPTPNPATRLAPGPDVSPSFVLPLSPTASKPSRRLAPRRRRSFSRRHHFTLSLPERPARLDRRPR
jgi:hypothetical protein